MQKKQLIIAALKKLKRIKMVKYSFFLFFAFCSSCVFSQKLILVNAKCKDLPVTILYIGVRNEVYLYNKESKTICKNVSLKYDSSIVIQQNQAGVFTFFPKSYQQRKKLYVTYNNETDSLVVDIDYYPLKFNITPNLPNHSTLTNYDMKGLFISDTRYRCDSLINNMRILKYTIELVRDDKVIKSVMVNKLIDRNKLASFKKLLQPNDLLYARNILIKSSLGFKYTIDSYLLRKIY